MKAGNIFEKIPKRIRKEISATIHRGRRARIERIVSMGQKSPEGFWYDQDRDEWVIVLRGAGRLKFEGRKKPVSLRAGDHLFIPAHRRHRVEWTRPGSKTVWLAVWF